MCLPVKPYKVEREWEHAGLKCAVVQATEGGHRCGYVRVPPSHPCHGVDYNDPDVSVHGGLTFGELEPCAHEDGSGYWLGFDCAHLGDLFIDPNFDPTKAETERGKAYANPLLTFTRSGPGHYWTMEEVVAETERLACQLANYGNEI